MSKLTVNGKEIEFDDGITVLQACEMAGEEIPRFCYHERLKIAGNCRMCLVQIEGGPPKPAVSCAMPAADGMVVHTNTEMVKKAREGVMEFLLINHPLDCPICDQGGECDLQDQAMAYGRGGSRFTEHKRAVEDKNMGPLVKTHMTRCIQCTRCIRFMEDVAGTTELGAINRGEKMQITTYLQENITSELSGNIIDLCPVGALTSKPYAFNARPWELTKTESIDVLDAVGSSIRVDSRGTQVMRILPRLHEDVNEEWISDKSRFSCDGLKLQRLDRPYVKRDGRLEEASWEEALKAISDKVAAIQPEKIAAIAGDLADCESMFLLKQILSALGSNNIDCRQAGEKVNAGDRSLYLYNTTIAKTEETDACLIIASNPRIDAPLVNSRLRKAVVGNGAKVVVIGSEVDLAYSYDYLGADAVTLSNIVAGKHPFSGVLKDAKNPMVILGEDAIARDDALAVISLACEAAHKYGMVRDDWNGFNVLHRAANRAGGLDLGVVPGAGGKSTDEILESCVNGNIELLFLLNADEFDAKDLGDAFVVYQGHHGDKGAHLADVILPGAAYTEKNATYVNTEGRVQRTEVAVFAPNLAKEDWQVMLDLARCLGLELPYSCLSDIREKMASEVEYFADIDEVFIRDLAKVKGGSKLAGEPFSVSERNFYMDNPISRASKVMAKCVEELLQKKEAA